MGEVIRLNASLKDEDNWWVQGGGDPTEPAAQDRPPAEAPTHLDPTDPASLIGLSDALWTIHNATSAADSAVTEAADHMTEGLDFGDLAATIALVQDIRRRLQIVEQYLTKRLGVAATEVNAKGGELPDGRRWEVKRGTNRKAWDHESWKHDARAKVAAATMDSLEGDGKLVAYVVDENTGEALDVNVAAVLISAMAAAQEVHGSTAPRVTQLRALGIDPDEYAETSAGPWGLVVASPDPTTTTEEPTP